MKKKAIRAILAIAVVATLVPGGAKAQPECESRVVLLSLVASQIAFNASPLKCSVGATGDMIDTRLIMPGSTSFVIRYVDDQGANVPTLRATVSGLGHEDTNVTLHRAQQTPIGSYVYDSKKFSLTLLDQGCVRIAVPSLDAMSQYHTIAGSC